MPQPALFGFIAFQIGFCAFSQASDLNPFCSISPAAGITTRLSPYLRNFLRTLGHGYIFLSLRTSRGEITRWAFYR
jgi:hypothetical protein